MEAEMDNLHTTTTFQALKTGADAYIQRRNQRLLANHRKELRNFTRAEASAYLGIDFLFNKNQNS